MIKILTMAVIMRRLALVAKSMLTMSVQSVCVGWGGDVERGGQWRRE